MDVLPVRVRRSPLIRIPRSGHPQHLLDPPRPRWRRPLLLGILAVSFCLAALVRFRGGADGGVFVDRHFSSAIFARALYLPHPGHTGFPPVSLFRQGLRTYQPVEPPVTEYLASILYRLAGHEDLMLARALTVSFWLGGGIFLFLIARMFLAAEGALIATLYYLFLPRGILVSRSFQPDSLMILSELATLFLVLKYFEAPSRARLLGSAALAGLAILHRPFLIFPLPIAFAALAVHGEGSWRAMFRWRMVVFGLLGLAPAALYYGYMIRFAGSMQWNVQSSFMLGLLRHREFWTGWWQVATECLGVTALIAACIGFPLLPSAKAKVLIAALGFAYLLFGFVFTYHIHTHGYYHIQLIPVVAISAGCLGSAIFGQLRASGARWEWLALGPALLLALVVNVQSLKEGLRSPEYESPAVAREIGDLVGHSREVVFVARYYGIPLQYNGRLTGTFWPRSINYWLYRAPGERELSVSERMDALPFRPAYFVVTDFEEWREHHQDLAAYLEASCRLLRRDPAYLIYTSCTPPRDRAAVAGARRISSASR